MTRLAVCFFGLCASANSVIAQSLDSVDLFRMFLVPPSKSENGFAFLTNSVWDEFAILAALSGVSRENLEREFELGPDASFKERKDRSALVDSIYREAQRYSDLKNEILGSTFFVYSNIPVPKYEFGAKRFTFCVPSTIYPRIPNSSLLSDLGLQFSPQIQVNFDDLTGLFGPYTINRCRDPKNDFEDYDPEPVTIQGLYVMPTVSLNKMFFNVSDLNTAEKLSARMELSEDDTMQAEIVCSPLTFSSNAVGRCKPIAISFGFFTDDYEVLLQYQRTSDGSWISVVGEKFR